MKRARPHPRALASELPPIVDLNALRTVVNAMVDERVEQILAERGKPDEFLSTVDAAGFAKVAPGTIRRWMREGRLPVHRAGRELRVRRDELVALLEAPITDEELSPETLAERDFRQGLSTRHK